MVSVDAPWLFGKAARLLYDRVGKLDIYGVMVCADQVAMVRPGLEKDTDRRPLGWCCGVRAIRRLRLREISKPSENHTIRNNYH